MLAKTPGKRFNKYVRDYVIFDLETTGISCANDEVIEISAVKVRSGQIVGEYSTLVNPKRPIPERASRINGIYNHMVEESPDFEEALKGFLEFAGDDILVGHNIQYFDMRFISRDALRYWGMTVGNDYIDTLAFSRKVLPGLKHYKLVDLAKHYGIPDAGAHRALNDCRMNQQVFEFLGKETGKVSDKAGEICPICGAELIRRKGRFGEFWGCTGFPRCRFTKN